MAVRYPTPTKPGWYWAKLVHPSRMPESEDWKSVDWEIVHVDRNILEMDGKAEEDGEQEFSVLVTGIAPAQWIPDFIWGPEVERFCPVVAGKSRAA